MQKLYILLNQISFLLQKCYRTKMAAPAFLSLLPLGSPPKYLNLIGDNETSSFNEIRKDFADVRLISSENETFICSKLFLASASRFFYELIQDVMQLDDSGMIVIHTNLSSNELKIVTEFIMFGYLPSSIKVGQNEQHIQCVPPDKKALSLLRCFGIDAASYSFHYTTPKTDEERLVHITENEDFFWLQNNISIEEPSKKYKEEVKKKDVSRRVVDDSSFDNNDFLNGSEFLVPDMSFYGQDVAFQTRTKLYPDAQVKTELDMEDFNYDEEDMEAIGEDNDPTYHVSLPRRKRKRTQKSVHKKGDSEAKRKKKRVGEFYNQFVAEADKHSLSHASFAAYLGYRASLIDDDPVNASTHFKRLHEGGNDNEIGASSSLPQEKGDHLLLSTQNGKSQTNVAPFMNLTYEEKDSCVGTFYDTFIKEAESQGISATSLASYCGARSTYRTDRATAAVFRKLHDGEEEDTKDKWSFKLWSLVDKDKKDSSLSNQTQINSLIQLDNKETQCTACGKALKGKVALRSHMKKLHPNYDNRCLSCNQGHFSNWQEHIDHANQFHDGIIRRKCNVCELMFDSAEELNSHKSSQHSGKAGLVTCTECGKQLMPDTMKGHMITEHGTEPCSCPKCGKQFKHPLALDQHFKRAHEECQCDECGRVSFTLNFTHHTKTF